MNEIAAVDVVWDRLPTRRELAGQLDRVAMPADAKVLMGRLLESTTQIAGRIVEVGRGIIAFVLELLRRYPNTALGLLVGVTVTFLLGAIPILGLVLGPLIGPLVAAFTITVGALSDMKNSSIERQIELFSAKLDAVIARG